MCEVCVVHKGIETVINIISRIYLPHPLHGPPSPMNALYRTLINRFL